MKSARWENKPMKEIPRERLRKIRIWIPGRKPTELRPYDFLDKQGFLIDLASNDYLSLSRHPEIIEAAKSSLSIDGAGSGASRLITGTRKIHADLEEELADWLGKERVFLFPSGFQANLAAVIALANRHTIIVADKMIHHSLLVGIKASGAKLSRYQHNNLHDLKSVLEKAKTSYPQSSLLVITESLFSMEGTSPDLEKIASISEKYGAQILVDEAHALGIMGPKGKGLAHKISDQITMISGTFGKAFGSGGAFLACNSQVGEHLLQNSGAFRYTTALAPSLAASSLAALNLIKKNSNWGEQLLTQSSKWRQSLHQNGWGKPQGNAHILSLVTGSDKKAIALEKHLEDCGIATIAIRPPTVPENSSRVRIIVRRNLPDKTLEKLLNALNQKK